MANFKSIGLSDALIEAISYMGFEEATPIQEQAIPKILNGKDLLGVAQTGTGKTAAFVLPILDQLAKNPSNKTRALILAPTRELAIQIERQIQGFSYFTDLSSIAIYGGGDGIDWDNQKKALKKGADIIVATPGKLISHLQQDYVNFDGLEFFVLDEADRMLDIGFYDDIMDIVKKIPKNRQSLLFSATMPKKIKDLSKEILTDPDQISLKVLKPAEGITQAAYFVEDGNKAQLIRSLIDKNDAYKSIIVFCATKKDVNLVRRALNHTDYKVEAISSDLNQDVREQVLNDFKHKLIRVLVATDVISRGIDIKDIDLVINYNVPNSAEDYVHRVGRTARAASEGLAITLVNHAERKDFSKIEDFLEMRIMKLQMPDHIKPISPKKHSDHKRGRGGRSNHPKSKGKKPWHKKKSSGPKSNNERRK